MQGCRRTMFPFALFVCVALSVCTAGSAFAQRGADFVVQEPASKGPGSGFPGLLDTEVARPGSVVIQAPALTTHVGITQHLTLATSLLYDAVSLSGNPGGLGWLRYRVRGTAAFQSTVDAIGGGFRVHSGSGDLTRHTVFAGISNNTFQLGERHRLTLNVLVGDITVGIRDSSGTTDVAVRGVATGLTYNFRAARWCALSASLLPVPLLFGRVENASNRADVNLTGFAHILNRTVYRAFVLFQAGDHFTFEVGGLGIGKNVLPWLSVGVRFR